MASQKRQIMSDYSSLVWEWNAKRQAINPNHVSDPQIEYLTRKASGRRSPMRIWSIPFIAPPCARAKVPRVKHSTARDAPTTCAAGSDSTGVYPQAVLCARNRWSVTTQKRPCAGCSVRLNAMSLRRVDAVNAQYLPQAALPAILAPLRDDFHLLPWADKNA